MEAAQRLREVNIAPRALRSTHRICFFLMYFSCAKTVFFAKDVEFEIRAATTSAPLAPDTFSAAISSCVSVCVLRDSSLSVCRLSWPLPALAK